MRCNEQPKRVGFGRRMGNGPQNMLAVNKTTAFFPYSGVPARGMLGFQGMTRSRLRMATAAPIKPTADDMRRSALMAAAQDGDRAAYETLLRESVPLIRAIARRQGVSADQVDDVVQEVLLTIHRARQTYDPSRSFNAWLRVIAERRAIDLLRQTGRRGVREVHAPIAFENYADDSADPARGLQHDDDAGRVSQALASLPPRQREAVQSLVLNEQSLAEASAATRRSKGSLKVNLHRALKALRGSVEREG
jgi:RNA polymerase sigma factor (sigma-70 family)